MLIPSQAIKSPEKNRIDATTAAGVSTTEGNAAKESTGDEQKDCTAETDSKDADAQNKGAEDTTTTQFVAPESSTTACLDGQLPDLTDLMTQFLSLDKCLPRRQYLSIVHIPVEEQTSEKLEYDLEWLAVLRKTHDLSSANRKYRVQVPRDGMESAVPDTEIEWIRERLEGDVAIPENFEATVPPYVEPPPGQRSLPPPLPRMGNPQTDRLLDLLQLEHQPNLTIPYAGLLVEPQHLGGGMVAAVASHDDENEIHLDDDDDAGDPAVVDDDEIDLDDAMEDFEEVGSQAAGSPQVVKRPKLEGSGA